MERLVKCIVVFLGVFVLAGSCFTPKLQLNDLRKCHQILIKDGSIFCLVLHDSWGEENDFILYNKQLEKVAHSGFRVDPIPRISRIENDTIILKYIVSSYFGESNGEVEYIKPDIATTDRLGKYIIIWEYSCEVAGSGFGKEIPYDSVSVSRDFDLIFYLQGETVVDKNISEYNFYGDFISYDYVLKDSLPCNTLLKEDRLIPMNDSIQEKCYHKIYETLKRL